LHCAIGPILAKAQLFGILPVSGICKPNPSQLKFAIFSFHTAYTVFINAIVLVAAIWTLIGKIRILSYISDVKGKLTNILCFVSYPGNNIQKD